MDSNETTPSWTPNSAPTSNCINASIASISRVREEEDVEEGGCADRAKEKEAEMVALARMGEMEGINNWGCADDGS